MLNICRLSRQSLSRLRKRRRSPPRPACISATCSTRTRRTRKPLRIRQKRIGSGVAAAEEEEEEHRTMSRAKTNRSRRQLRAVGQSPRPTMATRSRATASSYRTGWPGRLRTCPDRLNCRLSRRRCRTGGSTTSSLDKPRRSPSRVAGPLRPLRRSRRTAGRR